MPDPNRTFSRLPRIVSGLGRTPSERALLLLAGGLVAFLFGRWSAGDSGNPAAQRAKNIPQSVTGTPLVLDGDTLDFDGVRVRLFGIDAFERDQLCERADGSRYGCGQLSRAAMVEAIDSAPVTCTRRDVDPYGRMVGVCVGRQGDLSRKMVEEGAALAYRHYSSDYIDEEEKAHAAKRGVWEGRFEAPWDYRHNGEGKQVR